MDNDLEQWWHFESMQTRSFSPLKRPCTKDVANAYSTQALKMFSPVENTSLCGVIKVVTGKAQLTLPSGLRTRKNKFRSRSDKMRETFCRSNPVTFAMPSGEIGLLCRGISRTTKSRTRW